MMKRRAPNFIAVLVLLIALLPSSAAAEETAVDITRGCLFARDGKNSVTLRISDRKLTTSCVLEQGERLTVCAKDGGALGTLYLRFDGVPAAYSLAQYGQGGALLSEETLSPALPYAVLPLSDGCLSAELRSDAAALSVCEANVYSPGALPADVPVWEEPVAKTDILIVTTHPDDEWLFLGAVYPIYGGERGLCCTFAYLTTPSYGRLHEALNGLWRGGVRTYPFFLGFPDIDRAAPEADKAVFTPEAVTLPLVRLYRMLRPLIVVTQDPIAGEYGHFQHIIGANAAIDAAEKAADPAFDPDSAATYGVWEPLKVYAHMYPENTLALDVDAPLAAYGGETALAVMRYAYKAHVSQQEHAFRPEKSDRLHGDVRQYGLVRTAVGSDTGNDLFEHIDPGLTVEALANATPVPTAVPTPAATPEPTAIPVFTAVPASTTVPVPAEPGGRPVLGGLIAAGCLLAAAGLTTVFVIRRKKR